MNHYNINNHDHIMELNEEWAQYTPQKLLELLATDEDTDVRWTVAENPNTSQKTLELLANDKHYGVRIKVALNPN